MVGKMPLPSPSFTVHPSPPPFNRQINGSPPDVDQPFHPESHQLLLTIFLPLNPTQSATRNEEAFTGSPTLFHQTPCLQSLSMVVPHPPPPPDPGPGQLASPTRDAPDLDRLLQIALSRVRDADQGIQLALTRLRHAVSSREAGDVTTACRPASGLLQSSVSRTPMAHLSWNYHG
ncbi:hypothetical protein PR202_ga17279 [Eleusine coracana subsp. coracana]|uniref:Uncharacterized protein n=1 Tax=Eleusine coracana subsp. coracana TaxID=191504 RepID=A0AAV5CPK6_ELECO|nr:hypothetical protein PR202_ga17279 [Eleusine coracana subsp. coracana]